MSLTERSLPEGILNLTFHYAEPGYGEAHFDRLMNIDKVAIAMYGCLYDDLGDEEEQDLVIAHCLGLEAKKDPTIQHHVHGYPRGVPRSQRRI